MGQKVNVPEMTLPELPGDWHEWLLSVDQDGPGGSVPDDVKAWFAEYGAGKACSTMASDVSHWVQAMSEGEGIAGRHPIAADGSTAIIGNMMRYGHTGAAWGLEQLREAFLASLAGDRRRHGNALAEWNRMCLGAIAKHARYLVDGKPPEDECASPIWVDFDREHFEEMFEAQRLNGNGNGSASKLLNGVRTGKWNNAQVFPPLKFAIPRLAPEGFMVIAAPPKSGKSVLVYQFGLAAAEGGSMFGMKCKKYNVLYLALEDSDRRIQTRASELRSGKPMPPNFQYILSVRPGKLIPTVRAWLKAQEGPCLVLIDTLGKAMEPAVYGETPYARDYRIASDLKLLADSRPGITVIANTHTRKMAAEDFVDTVSGTYGTVGASDHVMVISRKRGQSEGLLKITSRDMDDAEYALILERPIGWMLDGDTLDQASETALLRAEDGRRKKSERMQNIIDTVCESGGEIKIDDIIKATKEDLNTVKVYLGRAVQDGSICRVKRGVYGPPRKLKVGE